MRLSNRLRRHVMAAAVLSASMIATPALAIEFPIHANDLVPGERISTTVHGTGGGPQTGAHDLLLQRWIADNNWSRLKAGQTDKSVNSNYLIYKKPVYAMAGGTVIGCWRNAPENSGGRTNVPRCSAPRRSCSRATTCGIQQADGNIALYAHAPTGDIPANLCPHNAEFLTGTALGGPVPTQPEATVTGGATVTAGQLLYHVGNSGNSSEPHLHVHLVNASNAWQPMKFARGMTTPFNNGTASLNGPWTRLQGNALPMASILVWPPHPVGNWTYNGIDGPPISGCSTISSIRG